MSTIQYRVFVKKGEELVEGPDDADVVVTVPLAEAVADDFQPRIAYMRGRLKARGHTGLLLDALKSGEIAGALSRLSRRS